jgi:hypothetical protein
MSDPQFYPCPICTIPVPYWERYPLAVCSGCRDKACDDRERKLNFDNVSMSGGFEAIVANTKAEYASHICYIEGVKCWADEARFGGIAIERYDRQRFEPYDL